MTTPEVLRGPKGSRTPTSIQPTPEQQASTVCLTCHEETTNRDRYGARRCDDCCAWLDVAAAPTEEPPRGSPPCAPVPPAAGGSPLDGRTASNRGTGCTGSRTEPLPPPA